MTRVRGVVLLGLCALGCVNALTRTEVQEIRQFASKAYGSGKGPAQVMDSQGSFSHYVGRRMKALKVQQPYTVYMRPNTNYNNRQLLRDSQPAGAVSSYSYVPFIRPPNYLAPAPSYARPFHHNGPPPPPKFRFGGGPSFSYSFPPSKPLFNPQGYHSTFQPFQHFTVNNALLPQKLPQVQQFHDQKLKAVMTSQHHFNVQQAQAQVNQNPQNNQVQGEKVTVTVANVKENVEEVKEEPKKEDGPKNEQGNIKSNEMAKFISGQISYSPQTFELMPAEVFTRHLIPSDYSVTQYGPLAVTPSLRHPQQNPRFPVPIRYEPVPMTFQYLNRPQTPQPVHMTTVYQSEAYPEYTYHSGPNHHFMRFQSFIPSPSVIPIVLEASQAPKPTEAQGQEVKSGTENPESTPDAGIVFESARIPEDVARRPGGGHSRPQPLTPQEQRNVFTAAADSSMIVAPLVYTENSVKSNEEATSTSRSVSRSRSKKEEGVTSTVTKVLPGGKRVRLRKVKVTPKPKVDTSS